MPTIHTTTYRPTVHGFHFGNGFHHQVIPVSGPFPGWSTFGRCNGMAEISLDYFLAGRASPGISAVDFGLRARSGVGAASWSTDHSEVYARRDNVGTGWHDSLDLKTLEGTTVQDWVMAQAAQTLGTPAAASWGPDRVDMVALGTDRNVYHWWRDGTNWAPGENLGGTFDAFSSPAIAAPFAGRLELYALTDDHKLSFKYRDPDGSWASWASLDQPDGITLRGDPAAASQYGWMTSVVQGSDGAYWLKEWANGGWQPWKSLGGLFTSSPAIASPFPGRLEAYGLGTDAQVWVSIGENGNWNGWSSLGAPPPGLRADRPAAVGHWAQLMVFAVGNDGNVWRCRWAGNWQPWENMELPISDESRRLTDAIFQRTMGDTVSPLISDIALGLWALAFRGPAANFVTMPLLTPGQCFHGASSDAVPRSIRFLSRGQPIPLGLVDLGGGGFGHEVLCFGIDVDVASPDGAAAQPGPFTFFHVYDPNYPDRDDITIELDPGPGTIRSGGGSPWMPLPETWRALFVRDDYRQQTPPV